MAEKEGGSVAKLGVCPPIVGETPTGSPPESTDWRQLNATEGLSPTRPQLAGEGPPLEEIPSGLLIGGCQT